MFSPNPPKQVKFTGPPSRCSLVQIFLAQRKNYSIFSIKTHARNCFFDRFSAEAHRFFSRKVWVYYNCIRVLSSILMEIDISQFRDSPAHFRIQFQIDLIDWMRVSTLPKILYKHWRSLKLQIQTLLVFSTRKCGGSFQAAAPCKQKLSSLLKRPFYLIIDNLDIGKNWVSREENKWSSDKFTFCFIHYWLNLHKEL